jgi:hypothetical protein
MQKGNPSSLVTIQASPLATTTVPVYTKSRQHVNGATKPSGEVMNIVKSNDLPLNEERGDYEDVEDNTMEEDESKNE